MYFSIKNNFVRNSFEIKWHQEVTQAEWIYSMCYRIKIHVHRCSGSSAHVCLDQIQKKFFSITV